MIINKIKLKNIRSYLDSEINFPEGGTLLSGDIGSGKSSILLAIDFALFGLRKGSLSGNSLLRNGKNFGNIELHFNLDNKNVIVNRTLKREKDIVKQDSGYIIIDDVRREGTALELKQIILDLLNYPKELLTKSKSLIYRYTIYTPQEEMKRILTEERELRLDILRKVFGIDKYKRIKENSTIFVSRLKEKIKELNGMILDLDDKKIEKLEKEGRVDILKEEILKIDSELKIINNKIFDKKKSISQIEDKIEKYKDFKKQLEINEVELKNKLEQVSDIERKIEILNVDIERLEKETSQGLVVIDEEEIKNKENEIESLNKKIRELNFKINELNININNSNNIKDKISKMKKCPTCKQDVSEQYVNRILNEENSKIELWNSDLSLCKNELNENEIIFTELKKKLNLLNKNKQEFEILRLKLENLKEKEKEKDSLIKFVNVLEGGVKDLRNKKIELLSFVKRYEVIENVYNEEKDILERLLKEQRDIEVNKASLEREKFDVEREVLKLTEEINKKLKIEKELVNLNSLKYWLEEHFVDLVSLIEKQVMFKVHSDFDDLFQKWHNILVSDENLKIRLDEEFTPLIEQNGYDIDYDFLSGGEKTAAALAYRLALNQVINTLIGEIKTKDLLILDEPTDGFSDEQLDRIKIVLDELNVKQIIIVSHESKIESFVDNVIRLEKKDHVTHII